MKPRRLVRATTFSMSWSRGTVILPRPSPRPSPLNGERGSPLLSSQTSPFLEDRDYVAGWVFEPRYVWASVVADSSGDALHVGQALVVLEHDALAGQLAHCLVDVFDAEVEHRVRRGFVVRFWIDEDAVSDLQHQAGGYLLERKSQCLAIELLGRVEVVDRETAESVTCFDHVHTPLIW